jgi:hypothetical protein
VKEPGKHRPVVQRYTQLCVNPGRQHRIQSALAGLLGVIVLWFVVPAVAQQSLWTEPFAVRNQNPLILVYGLPATAPAELVATGESSLQLQFDLTNNSKISESSRERVILDGETYRTALIYKQGIADGWQLGVELPLIAHGSGFMDNFIENWHDAFGLSNSDREPWPKNRLLFSYSDNGLVEAEITDGTTGVGDLQLLLARRLTPLSEKSSLSLNASLKLPTGDVDRLQGSGAADLALWLSGAAPELFGDWHAGGYLQAGILLMGKGDLLPDRQRSHVLFGSVGLHWRAWPWLMLKAQIDAHGAFYDSELAQLGKSSAMLTVGGSIPVGQGAGAIDLAIGENLATNAVPDFMLNLAYRHYFH